MELITLLQRHGGLARCSTICRLIPQSQLRAALARGEVFRLHRGWYSLTTDHPALPVLGSGCALGCISALRALGVWTPDTGLHVHVPRSNSGRRLPDGVLHWGRTPAHGWLVSVPTAIRQAVSCLETEYAVAVIDSALHQGVLSAQQWTLMCHVHEQSVGRLRHLVDRRAESGLESLTRLRLVALHPQLQVEIGPHRVDLLVGRICIELDGFAHHGRDRFDADRRRDANLVSRGYQVLHFSYEQVKYRFSEVEIAVYAAVEADRRKQDIQRLFPQNRTYGS